MRGARYAGIFACKLSWIGGVVIVASWLVASSAPLESNVGGSDPSGDFPRVVVPNFVCETTEVRMHVAEGQPSSHYSMKDGEGKELLRVMYSPSGRVVVTWGEGYSVRAGCTATPGGAYDLTVVNGAVDYRLVVRSDSSSGFSVKDRLSGDHDALSVTPEGRLVHGPSVLARP